MRIHASAGTLEIIVRLAGLWGEGRAPVPLELFPLTAGPVLETDEFSIRCFPVRHRDTDSFGLSFQSQPRRHLQQDRLAAFGAPGGPVLKELAGGRPATLATGRIIDPVDVLGPLKRRKKLVVVGDTETAQGLGEHVDGADLLVIEAHFSLATLRPREITGISPQQKRPWRPRAMLGNWS
jgi:ribonuclease Z